MQILLVDDDAFSRKLMGYYLKPMEATVDMAAGGQECLDKVAQARPDLILMDCQMPEMDGFETVTRLRASGFTGVILALTGNSDPQTLQRCSEVGMNGHMSKPVDPANLREKILEAMGASTPVAEAPPPPAPEVVVEDPLARARAIATAARNPALMGRLVASFVKSTEDGLAQLGQAASQQDGPAVAAVAHRLRGSSGTFGATTFSQAAGNLEDSLQTQPLSQCLPLLEQLMGMWPTLKSQLEISGGTP